MQPSLRREWELQEAGAPVARLRPSLFRSTTEAEADGERWQIMKEGRLRSNYAVRDAQTGESIAALRTEGRKRVFECCGQIAEWKRLGRDKGWGAVERDGSRLLTVKARSGLVRVSGTVELEGGLPRRDALAAALLASYLVLRGQEQDASAAAAVATVSSTS